MLTNFLLSVCTAASFVGSLGINTHINYARTPYSDVGAVGDDLAYLGITHVRDAPPVGNGSIVALYASLVARGISFDFVGVRISDFHPTLGLDNFIAHFPHGVASIEGPNEVLNWPVTYNRLTGLSAAVALQKALYASVRADPRLSGVPVYNFTLGGGGPSQYLQMGDLSAYFDFGNAHIYPQGRTVGPYTYLVANLQWQTSIVSPRKPSVITEGGYYTMPDQKYGVNEDVQASFTLDFLLDAFLQGVKMTYLYELLDEAADPADTNMEDHFGLFRNDSTPKPAAVAVHNLTTILRDPNDTASAGAALAYSIAGLPPYGHNMELIKANGAHDIIVWAEPAIWNQSTKSEHPAPASNVIVNLGAVYPSISIYDSRLGTAAPAHQTNVRSVELALTDHPLIIEIGPAP